MDSQSTCSSSTGKLPPFVITYQAHILTDRFIHIQTSQPQERAHHVYLLDRYLDPSASDKIIMITPGDHKKLVVNVTAS